MLRRTAANLRVSNHCVNDRHVLSRTKVHLLVTCKQQWLIQRIYVVDNVILYETANRWWVVGTSLNRGFTLRHIGQHVIFRNAVNPHTLVLAYYILAHQSVFLYNVTQNRINLYWQISTFLCKLRTSVNCWHEMNAPYHS